MAAKSGRARVNAALVIGRKERDTLHWLMCRRLLVLGQDPPGLARKEGVGTDELAAEFGEDLRLMEDLGWEPERDVETVELTMPADSLGKTLKRLRRDARRAPCEERHELEAGDSAPERWERFRQAVDTCEELLDVLDSPNRDKDEEPRETACPLATSASELSPYTPVVDGLILEAVDRAECHEGAEEVWVFVVAEHLGFEPTPKTVAALHPQLEDLQRAGSLSRSQAMGRECWGLTATGQEALGKLRDEESIGELPESPQHRAWRHARVEAAVRIEEFKRDMAELWEETERLLIQSTPALSAEWFALCERFRLGGWRLGSAIHCLNEWVEPEDDRPDVDENPGPAPGRRTVAAWNGPKSSEPGGQA